MNNPNAIVWAIQFSQKIKEMKKMIASIINITRARFLNTSFSLSSNGLFSVSTGAKINITTLETIRITIDINLGMRTHLITESRTVIITVELELVDTIWAMLQYRQSEWTIGRSNQAYHIWYTLGEMLSAIEIVSRWYFFAYIDLDRIPKDLNDFSLAEPQAHARTTDRVLLFCFLHRLCLSELERPSNCCLYIRLRFFPAVHRGSSLRTSASRQWPCHLRIPCEAWCSIRLLIFQWIAARFF